MPPFTPRTRWAPSSIQRRQFWLDEPAGQGIYDTPYGYHFDLSQDADVPGVMDYGLGESMAKLRGFEGEINNVYDELIKSGERDKAFALRDAADKFRRTGAKYGVNSFRRARALKDLESSLTQAANSAKVRINKQRLADLRTNAAQLTNLSHAAFNRGMQRANFRERKLASLRGAQQPRRGPSFRSSRKSNRGRGPRFRRRARVQRPNVTGARERILAAAKRNQTAMDLAGSYRRFGGRGVLDRTQTGYLGNVASPMQQALGQMARREIGATRGGPPQRLMNPITVRNPNYGQPGPSGYTAPVAQAPAGRAGTGWRPGMRGTPTQQSVVATPSTAQRATTNIGGGSFLYHSPTAKGGFYRDPKTGKALLRAASKRFLKRNPNWL